MNVTINANITLSPVSEERILTAISDLANKLDSLTKGVHMADAALQQKIDALTASVADEQTTDDSIVTLVNGLTAMIADLKNSTTDPSQLAAIDAINTALQAEKAKIAAAVLANTPAAPPSA